jgi:hypothetical protein
MVKVGFVVGPSGSGKSSVVQAGLLPLLRREQPPAKTWDAVSFTPGQDPFHRLASALIPLLEPDLSERERLVEAEELGRDLAANRTRLGAVISRVIEKSNGTGRLLLVADQFEELFTLTPEPVRRPFAQALLHARGNAPVTVLVTLRAERRAAPAPAPPPTGPPSGPARGSRRADWPGCRPRRTPARSRAARWIRRPRRPAPHSGAGAVRPPRPRPGSAPVLPPQHVPPP